MPLKLVNAVPQRWVSMCTVLERVLKVWTPFKKAYDGDRDTDDGTSLFPLHGKKKQIMELYSLMKLVKDLIVKSQSRDRDTAISTWFALIKLRTASLKHGASLAIYDPAGYS